MPTHRWSGARSPVMRGTVTTMVTLTGPPRGFNCELTGRLDAFADVACDVERAAVAVDYAADFEMPGVGFGCVAGADAGFGWRCARAEGPPEVGCGVGQGVAQAGL